jgi:peptide/nickel transport system ATP-binding protein
MEKAKLLSVNRLSVSFPRQGRLLTAVNEVSFSLEPGQRLGLVGESGAGKSVTGFSIINLVSKPGFISGGSILFEGRELTTMPVRELRSIRGNRISMIFQDPMMTLNPVLSIGEQMTETLRAHRAISRGEARGLAAACLAKVHIASPEKRLRQYPHELSGGMRQRVVIAIALLADPSLIIADEPTTALDVTIQAEIMDLLIELCESSRMGLILITHDLGVVSQITHDLAVMYAGRIVETGPTAGVIAGPLHPYTQGLLAALPESAREGRRLNQIPGLMPVLAALPPGCSFHPRCPLAREECARCAPELRAAPGAARRHAACLLLPAENAGSGPLPGKNPVAGITL